MNVDLNSDMGEGFGAWKMGDDEAMLGIVSSASVACGRPAVKLSDNPSKAIGPKDQIERYKRVFGVGAQTAQPVLV